MVDDDRGIPYHPPSPAPGGTDGGWQAVHEGKRPSERRPPVHVLRGRRCDSNKAPAPLRRLRRYGSQALFIRISLSYRPGRRFFKAPAGRRNASPFPKEGGVPLSKQKRFFRIVFRFLLLQKRRRTVRGIAVQKLGRIRPSAGNGAWCCLFFDLGLPVLYGLDGGCGVNLREAEGIPDSGFALSGVLPPDPLLCPVLPRLEAFAGF